MKTSRQLGWQSSAWGAAAIVAVGFTLLAAPRTTRAQCTGDCDASTDVTVNELITMVNIALGTSQLSACPIGDDDGSGDITVNEIIKAVGFALTMCPVGGPTCGNHVMEAPETCDDGGTCAGGTNAGTACTKEADCTGNGICQGGAKAFFACGSNSDCTGPSTAESGTCIHCKTFGGDGCAANCTTEMNVVLTLTPGVVQGLGIKAGTSGAVVNGEILTIPLPLTGGQTFTIGQDTGNGLIPIAVKAASISFPRIPVSSLACACLRGVSAKTCGGTLFDIDGVTQSKDCTEGFTAGASVCPADKPCSFLHGPANAASGVVGCNGLAPVNLSFTQDSGGSTGVPGKPIITLSGSGGPGSVVLLSNNAIGTATGLCMGSDTDVYGADGQFCTDDDPQTSRGTPAPQINTTGTASAMITNANGTDDDTIGPFSVTGNPLSCSQLLTGNVSGAALAGAFVALNQPTLGDIAVTNALVGQ